ncbi:unnamed protein product [Cuscuta europaea]|uniref:Uncharacterized protein n=1 Tax=Cuscuta europaea TaxID=41803 RepID=A0A9P0YIU5_CUSEU|nr:unnamed protein product [Cuscuta europaea]
MDGNYVDTKEFTISDALVQADLVYSGNMINTLGFPVATTFFYSSHICAALESSVSELKLFLQDTMNSSVASLSTFLSKEYECIFKQLTESQGLNSDQSHIKRRLQMTNGILKKGMLPREVLSGKLESEHPKLIGFLITRTIQVVKIRRPTPRGIFS